MKTIIYAIVIILVVGSVNLMAQTTDSSNSLKNENPKHYFWYGFKVGTDLATPTFDESEIRVQLKSNYQVGLFFQVGRKIYLQPEFYYSVQKGNVEYPIGKTHETVDINSLKVPVLLGIRIIDLKIVSAHLMCGPMGTFVLDETKLNPQELLKKMNYKLQLGGGIDLLGCLTLDVRYAVNLNDQLREELNNLNWKNGVNVTLGLKLR